MTWKKAEEEPERKRESDIGEEFTNGRKTLRNYRKKTGNKYIRGELRLIRGGRKRKRR